MSGGAQEGTYIFQPKHMVVNYPCNIDVDQDIASSGSYDLHSSIPTSMSGFLVKIQLSELCREVVDTIPSMWLDPQDVDYSLIVSLDAKFQNFLKSLPYFFQLDPTNVQRSQHIYKERPYIYWQRTLLHFGTHTRICRLHRPFHLEFPNNPQYAFSRMKCIRAAQTILELRRSMDGEVMDAGFHASRCWAVTQHVFLAALTLATDVSIDPCASDTSARKAEVVSACRMLEKLARESVAANNGLQRGVQMQIGRAHV